MVPSQMEAALREVQGRDESESELESESQRCHGFERETPPRRQRQR